MSAPKITLEQWAALVSVVESGSYARAAEKLHKSQSTLSYAVKQIERLSGVRVFEIEGRRSVLTAPGKTLYRRGKILVEDAERVEKLAFDLAKGAESEVSLAVDVIFPTWLLLDCFAEFSRLYPKVWISLTESVLSGTTEALLEGRADIAIGSSIPQGFLGEPLMQIRFIPVAHPDHPLHQLDRPLDARDLSQHRRLVIRETGVSEDRNLIAAEQRWTVSNKATSIHAACMGAGFAWYPEMSVKNELDQGLLKPLPLRGGATRFATLYLMLADPECQGPALGELVSIIRKTAHDFEADQKLTPALR